MERIFASPLARRLATQAGIPLEALQGSGPHGRIVKADVDAAAAAIASRSPVPSPSLSPSSHARQHRDQGDDALTLTPPPSSSPAPVAPDAPDAPDTTPIQAPALATAPQTPFRLEPASPLRQTLARRLTEAKNTAPHFYLSLDCRMDALLAVRRQLNSRADAPLPLTLTDFLIRALALALTAVPAANVAWSDAGIQHYDRVDVAVAVASPKGLITPVLRAAENKGLATLALEMRDLTQRARAGRLKPHEYQGGSITLSNLGMYGVRTFSAILNPPQACILAVGAAEPRPVVVDGELAVATVMSCTLSVDHRAIDGATGAELLAAFRKRLEDPLTMLL